MRRVGGLHLHDPGALEAAAGVFQFHPPARRPGSRWAAALGAGATLPARDGGGVLGRGTFAAVGPAAQHEAGGAVLQAGELEPPRGDAPEFSRFGHHAGGRPFPQHRLHGRQRLVVGARLHQRQPAGIETAGRQAGGEQVRLRGDPDQRAGKPGQQAGDEGGADRPGLDLDATSGYFVQRAERQAAGGEAGIDAGIAERQHPMARLRLQRLEVRAERMQQGRVGSSHGNMFMICSRYRFTRPSRESTG